MASRHPAGEIRLQSASAHSEWMGRSHSLRAAIFAALILLSLMAIVQRPVRAAALVDRAAADAIFRQELTQLAAKCDELGLEAQRDLSRAWLLTRDWRRYYLFLPDESDATKPAADAERLVEFWHARFTEIRQQQAERLFELADRHAQSGDEPAAYRLLHEVLHENPDHQQARKVLGYTQGARGWRRGAARRPARRNRGPHPLLGWPSTEYWQVDSDHFAVTTNHSKQEALQVARYLERVYAAWQQLFYPYWSVPGRLAERFQGKDRSLGPERVFAVVLFGDREDYVRQLGRFESKIAMSVGYYAQEHKTAFFYAGDDSVRTTWVHESTHQFFQESGVVAPRVGEQNNFWIVEGVALYMESLADRQRYVTTGGVDADRLQFARFRGLSEGYYVPFTQLVTYGRSEMQKDPDIRKLYSQAAGQTHFLLHANDGHWLAPFIRTLQTVYRGVGQPETLQAELGEPSEQLDQRYLEFLNVEDADLQYVDPQLRDLCLGHTQVTSAGLNELSECAQLQWLDLSFTPTSDAHIAAVLAKSRDLQQLNLERTKITDQALTILRECRQLEELDLSYTAVSDVGLPNLSRLAQLKVLWLTGTQVTDAGLESLTTLRNLEQLHVQATQVTPAAIEQLRKRLPQLD